MRLENLVLKNLLVKLAQFSKKEDIKKNKVLVVALGDTTKVVSFREIKEAMGAVRNVKTSQKVDAIKEITTIDILERKHKTLLNGDKKKTKWF